MSATTPTAARLLTLTQELVEAHRLHVVAVRATQRAVDAAAWWDSTAKRTSGLHDASVAEAHEARTRAQDAELEAATAFLDATLALDAFTADLRLAEQLLEEVGR